MCAPITCDRCKNWGCTDLTVDDIVQLSIHRVRPEMIQEIRELGLD